MGDCLHFVTFQPPKPDFRLPKTAIFKKERDERNLVPLLIQNPSTDHDAAPCGDDEPQCPVLEFDIRRLAEERPRFLHAIDRGPACRQRLAEPANRDAAVAEHQAGISHVRAGPCRQPRLARVSQAALDLQGLLEARAGLMGLTAEEVDERPELIARRG